MLSGTRLRVVGHAAAEIANTTSPSSTHGDVIALTMSDELLAFALPVTSVMPCLRITWPAAAEKTAKSRKVMLAVVTVRLLAGPLISSNVDCVGSIVAAGGGPASVSFDDNGVLHMRTQPKDELVDEEGGPVPDQPRVDPPQGAHLPAVGGRHDTERQAGAGLLDDVEAAAAYESVQRRPGEEPQVRLVEDAAPVVPEQTERDPGTRVPVPEVRYRQQKLATGTEYAQDLRQRLLRPG